MKRVVSIICCLLISIASVFAAVPVDLSVQKVDPSSTRPGGNRTPVAIPEVSLDVYTLLFITPCDGCTLRLLDEDGDVAYATVIPIGATTLALPTTLAGDYELQIIRGSWCFYGDITL